MNSTTSSTSPAKNVLYAQAGGVSAVINASAAAVIETVLKHPDKFGKMYAAFNGIKGVLEENLVDLSNIECETLEAIKSQPGAVFRACRFDLEPLAKSNEQYERVLEVFRAYEIGYFFYNGGNGSMVTAQKVADYCGERGHPVICVGVAKTVDNDLDLSHCSPGFGSAAKYIATSFLEATLDIISMHETSTKFFIMECMGRNAGWLTIAAALIKDIIPDAPIVILPPERVFDEKAFITKVEKLIEEKGYCVCAVSEGIKDKDDHYVTIASIEHTIEKDYTNLGGVGHTLSHLVSDKYGIKTHCAIPDYLQRSASHMVSKIDWLMAYGAGKAAVFAAINGQHGVLPIIKVTSEHPFEWTYENVALEAVADLEKLVPDEYLTEDGMDVTEAGLNYLRPLIQGNRFVPYRGGLPSFPVIKFNAVEKQLSEFVAIK
ncbi:MAG: ATP-dependent phosphofructokinase/diphosphate-dependent phosphofructokinase [Thiomicrorhabdus sp.]|nr:MAG: ATP-dependent phosphofructokinase/diphosphate-dependent phosphofructokinase [Thiomicrorhabdus sp.]